MRIRTVSLLLGLIVLPAVAGAQSDQETRSTDMIELIELIANSVNKEVIVDPRLPESLNGFTTETEPDYDSFLGLLRLNDYAVVETADQILIVPDQFARSLPSRLLQEDDSRVSDHEIVTRIIDIPTLPDTRSAEQIQAQQETNPFTTQTQLAPQLVPLLRPMMPQSAMLGAIPNLNKLVIVDRYDNVRRITAIIEEIIADL